MDTTNSSELTGVCGTCGNAENVIEVFIDEESQGEACYNCCGVEGYCFGCGQYSGGFDAFEFNDIGPYCEQCQEQIEDAFDESDEELEEWEYPVYPKNANLN
jgi:hypothetical protein